MKKLLYLTTLYFLLTTCTYSQWWVNGGNLIWPYGTVYVKSDASRTNATFRAERHGHSWFAAVEGQTFVTPDDINVNVAPIALYGSINFIDSNHVMQNSISSLQTKTWIELTGSANFTSTLGWGFGPRGAGFSLQFTDNHSNNLTQAYGVYNDFLLGSTGNDTTQNYYAFYSHVARWGGSRRIKNAYAYYAHNSGGYWSDNYYHFYGSGDYPSYFGGDLEADGDVVKFENLPSDSTGLSTGQLYFDSNGFLKRKF